MKLINVVEDNNLVISKDYETGLYFRPIVMTDDLTEQVLLNIFWKKRYINVPKQL